MAWQVDPVHSSVEFSIRHMVISSTKGKFHDYSADANIDESDVTKSTGTLRIKTASVDTRNDDRDNHLRSPDFFDVEKFPEITFAVRRVEPKGGDHRIVGDLTIRDVTKEVALDAEIQGPIKDPWGGTRYGVSATSKISRKDFGLTWNAALETGGVVVGDDVKLSADFEFVKMG